jgi:hypothetical protein
LEEKPGIRLMEEKEKLLKLLIAQHEHLWNSCMNRTSGDIDPEVFDSNNKLKPTNWQF